MAKFTRHIFFFLNRFRYQIVAVAGLLMVGVLDENSFMKRIEYSYQINDLKAEIEKYDRQYQHDTKQLKELRRNPKAIAKIARERYFMKADDEDIFVLSDDEQPVNNESKYETTD
ncbi:FtsB family cell division protein [Prevotella dentasini]|uniref:FtsB family cell division protein n=1 Tax=Prevotella dentasini TaxID=589537 RepID=UPI000469330E|nr:septum formation initiator family protein [Prevotella dentasini]